MIPCDNSSALDRRRPTILDLDQWYSNSYAILMLQPISARLMVSVMTSCLVVIVRKVDKVSV